MSGATRKARGLSSQRGFTLIELLVVIAIIGLLSSVILAALGGAKTKAQNARIQGDIHSYQEALELYFSQNGAYPVAPSQIPGNNSYVCLGNYGGDGSTCWNTNWTEDGGFDARISPYIPGPPAGQTVTGGGHTFVGYLYECLVGAGNQCTKYRILWMMNGTSVITNNISPLCGALTGTHGDIGDLNSWGLFTECQVTVQSS